MCNGSAVVLGAESSCGQPNVDCHLMKPMNRCMFAWVSGILLLSMLGIFSLSPILSLSCFPFHHSALDGCVYAFRPYHSRSLSPYSPILFLSLSPSSVRHNSVGGEMVK